MTNKEYADVVIVGAGAGGATVGAELAEAGAKVVFLEAGMDLDITYGSENHFAESQNMGNFVDQDLFWHEQYTGTNWRTDMGECVGGGTTTYGGVLEESVPEDFKKWPFSHEEFKPYIQLTKKRYHVGRWNIEDLSPCAKHLHEISEGELEPIQSGYLKEPFEEFGVYHGKCNLCRMCLMGCKFNAKSNALTITLPKAKYYGATIKSNCLVTKLVTNISGTQITSIKYLKRTKTGRISETLERKEIFADKFILASGAMMTPMILHWSGSWGKALANSSGQVGKNLRAHFVRHTMGILNRDDLKTYIGQVVELGDKFKNYHKGFLTEYNMVSPPSFMSMIFEIMKSDVTTRFVGVDFKRLLRKWGSVINATPMAKSEDNGFTDNFVLPHKYKLNKYGLSMPNVHLEPNETEAGYVEVGAKYAGEMLRKAGADSANIFYGKIDNVHKKGSCRMGTDPSDSVTDLNGKCWDLDNLWISDGSLFPAPLMANCAFIIYALAYKVADGILDRDTPVD
ncbi:MAG: GMC family oxidoreductase [Desulfobacteraceae bacterium]|nr:GMC family oxidoreductase [Desulfobacteraceae bacterium]